MTIPDRGDFSGLSPNTNARAKIELELLLDSVRMIAGAGLDWQDITISGGSINPALGSSSLLNILGEGSLPDTLTTISRANWDDGQIVILRADSDAITVSAGGNISPRNGSMVMPTNRSYMALFADSIGGGWVELARFYDSGNASSAGEFRTYWGLQIGADVQPFDADLVATDVANDFTAQQRFVPVAISGSPVTWDLALAQVATTTLTAPTVQLQNPTNPLAGGHYTLIVEQDATGNRGMTFDTAYRFPAGNVPDFSLLGPSRVGVLSFVRHGSVMLGASAMDYTVT